MFHIELDAANLDRWPHDLDLRHEGALAWHVIEHNGGTAAPGWKRTKR